MALISIASHAGLIPLCIAAGCKTGGSQITDAPKDQAYHAHVITSELSSEPAHRRVGGAQAVEHHGAYHRGVDGQPQRLHPKRGHGSLYLQDDPTSTSTAFR